MEPTELIIRLIETLRQQIEIREFVIKALASGFVVLATVIASFFFIYRKDKKRSDDRFYVLHNDLIRVIEDDTRAKAELREAIKNNTLVVREFPGLIKDTIITTIKLAMK
jgi:hypothetical protein